jgi:hypothetical protein
MSCSNCGQVRILYDGDIICPKCSKLAVLDFKTGVGVATRLVHLTERIFNEELSKWDRDILLGNLVAKRELFSRAFFREHSLLNVEKLAEMSVLIKRIVKFSSYSGKSPKQADEIDNLLEMFGNVMRFETILLGVKSNRMNILCLRKFKEDFTLEETTSTFRVVDNENYLGLQKTFEYHNIFPENIAQEKFSSFVRMETPNEDHIQNKLLAPVEFIHRHYELLCSLLALFHRNKILSECFDLEYFQEILGEPRELIEFVATCFQDFGGDVIMVCPTKEFMTRASKYFDLPENQIKKTMLFDVNNKFIFPLFVRFRIEGLGDNVCITKDFSRFIYTILHAIITKQFFDDETVRVSKDFENNKVQAKFQEYGYLYLPNILDKKKASLQIDGIAIKNQTCYIVECKGRRFPRLIDEPETIEHIIRDLKGIVLGKEYSTKRGQIIERDKPSILNKIEFVKQNIVTLGLKYDFDCHSITVFKGLVITIDNPPIPKFNGIEMKSIYQIIEPI